MVEVTAEEAEATGNAQAVRSYHAADQKLYEITRFMKTQMVKAARVILCLAVLVATYGCATLQNSASRKSWSQIAAGEEQEQQLSEWPEPS